MGLIRFRAVYRHKLTWLLEHVLFAGIPVYLAVTQFAGRPAVHYALMVGVVCYMSLIAFVFGVHLRELGFSKRTGANILELIPGTLIICGLIMLARSTGLIHPPMSGDAWHLVSYVLLSVPLQELVFRSFCMWRCSLSWQSHLFYILFTSANVAFYHTLYGDWQLIVGVFLINLYWSALYVRRRDVAATAVSHALVGIVYFA